MIILLGTVREGWEMLNLASFANHFADIVTLSHGVALEDYELKLTQAS